MADQNIPTSGDAGFGYVQDNPVVVYWPASDTQVTSTGATSTGGSRGGGSISGSGSIGVITPAYPVPDFTSLVMPLRVVQFTDDSLNGPFRYLWTFGDGTTSTQQNPIHAYASANVYTVTLAVQNSAGIRTISKSIAVQTVQQIVTITATVGGFTAYCRFAGNFVPSSYLWDFGDGETSTEAAPNHVYAANGNYTINLLANGTLGTTSVTIDTEIVLTWQDNSSDELGFRIYHSLDGLTGWTLIKTVGAGVTSYGVTLAIDGVDSTIMNYFKVVAYNAGGESAATDVVAVQCGGA